MQVDKYGNTRLIDRDTGKPHVCSAVSAREILLLADPAEDGDPRYVREDMWDGVLSADGAKVKAAAAKVAAAEAKAKAEAEVEAERQKIKAMVDAEIERQVKAGSLTRK